jgi:hypothetical protein
MPPSDPLTSGHEDALRRIAVALATAREAGIHIELDCVLRAAACYVSCRAAGLEPDASARELVEMLQRCIAQSEQRCQ